MRSALALLTAATVASGCHSHGQHDHSDDHPEGHDHHEQNHGHHDGPVARITTWSDEVEIFAEHPIAVVGKEVELLVHVSILGEGQPLTRGRVRFVTTGPKKYEASSDRPVRPGIYELSFTPSSAGVHKGEFLIEGEIKSRVPGIRIEVHPNQPKDVEEEEEGQYIEFLKEQQWGVPFHSEEVEVGSLVETIEVAGTISTPPNGSADVGAPLSGRLVAPPRGLPHPGTEVKKGQLLASLAPAPASPEAATRGKLAVAEAEARLAAAQKAVGRAERLLADSAISEREVEDARREVRVAEAAVSAARSTASLFSGAQGGGGAGTWRIQAPISGTLAAVNATPGQSLNQGDLIFQIVNTEELWLRARVPEQDAARLRADHEALFQVSGLEDWRPLRLSGDDANAAVVTISRVVDPKSRTVDIIYALKTPAADLRVGGLVQMALPTGDDFNGIVVPNSAVIDSDGRNVVYVQVDGEHFEERLVHIGPRAGDRLGVISGLKPGERVVTRGTHLVYLASRASSEQPHGHIH